jgi:hypothetical protein
MDEEYETTIEIIKNDKKGLSFEKVPIDSRTRKPNSKVMPSLKRLPTSLAEAVEDTEVAEAGADPTNNVVRREVAAPAEGHTGRSSAPNGTRQTKKRSGCSLTKENITRWGRSSRHKESLRRTRRRRRIRR